MLSPISVNKLGVLCLLLLLFTVHVTSQGDNSSGCGDGAGSDVTGSNNSNNVGCGGSKVSSGGGNLSHGDIGGIVVGVVVAVSLFVLGYLKWKKIKKWYRGRREKSSNRSPVLPTTERMQSVNTPVA